MSSTDPQLSTPTAAAKASLRLQMRALRDARVGAGTAGPAEAAARHALPLVDQLGTIALYAALGSELDPEPLARQLRPRGVRLVYPRVVGDHLEFRVESAGPWVPGPLGLREPPASAALVALAEIDAFVVPGLAFDRRGGRLGWGRGYYDRTLADARAALRLGYGYECQVVDQVPCGLTDQPMDHLITEVTASPVSTSRTR